MPKLPVNLSVSFTETGRWELAASPGTVGGEGIWKGADSDCPWAIGMGGFPSLNVAGEGVPGAATAGEGGVYRSVLRGGRGFLTGDALMAEGEPLPDTEWPGLELGLGESLLWGERALVPATGEGGGTSALPGGIGGVFDWESY